LGLSSEMIDTPKLASPVALKNPELIFPSTLGDGITSGPSFSTKALAFSLSFNFYKVADVILSTLATGASMIAKFSLFLKNS